MLLSADRVLLPDGRFHAGAGVEIDAAGKIVRVGSLNDLGRPSRVLRHRALLPGMVNAHSHAFQRLLRGRTQRFSGEDTFWTWREVMYHAASRLGPRGLFVATKHAFLEMLLAGVTTVGEFHYVHHQPDGTPYPDAHELGETVARAAQGVGIRLCLLRVTYLSGGFGDAPSALQRRFIDPTLEVACERSEELQRRLIDLRDPRITSGVAAHSIRAVPPDAMAAMKARFGHLPFHVHASEQPLEVAQCREVYGDSPIAVIGAAGVLDSLTTLVHATHATEGELELMARSGSVMCVCPTTEADLGDGLGPVHAAFARGVPLALGTDGQTTCSVLEEARRLEMHARLQHQRRAVLASPEQPGVAATAFECATVVGARALAVPAGQIRAGAWADLVSVDLEHPTLVDADDESLLAALLFSAPPEAVRDVMVCGRFVVEDGEHPERERSGKAMRRLAQEVFG